MTEEKKAPKRAPKPETETKPEPAPEVEALAKPAEPRNLTRERIAARFGDKRAADMVK